MPNFSSQAMFSQGEEELPVAPQCEVLSEMGIK